MKQPVLFVGHGSPMAAIEKNKWSQALNELGEKLPRPAQILVISAHWETDGLQVCAVERPKTIHDFFGFPDELYQIRYPAPGAPALAQQVAKLTGASLDRDWGLDHGAWSVLLHLYPQADIPVVQMSLNHNLSEAEHWQLAQKLQPLREQNVLILASGNIVHNLRRLDWEAGKADPKSKEAGKADHHAHPSAAPWNLEFDTAIAEALVAHDHKVLQDYTVIGPSAQLSVPTKEHYWPLLYAAALAETHEAPNFFYIGYEYGSLSMRSVAWGL